MQHPEKDVEGRYRIVLIVWDKNTAEEIIKETIEALNSFSMPEKDFSSSMKLI